MGNLFSRRDQHPFFGDVITKARNMKKSNLLRQHYIEPPPKSRFYDLITVTKTMPAKKLLLGAFGTSIFTVLLISTLYYGASCVGTSFDNIIMITLQQIIGAGTAEGFEQTFVCRTLVTGTTLLNVVFKSVTFALMVSKFDNVTPQIYFTPNCVMNFRNGMNGMNICRLIRSGCCFCRMGFFHRTAPASTIQAPATYISKSR